MKCVLSLLVLGLMTSVTEQYASTAELEAVFACKNEPESLMKMTQECRTQYSGEELSVMRKKMDMISGDFVATMLRKYCKIAEEVNVCVKIDINFATCSANADENFESAMLKTNWLCQPEVQDKLITKLTSIPWVSLKPSDRCYQESVKKTYQCIRRFLTSRPTDTQVVLNRVIASVPCAFRRLRKLCGPQDAFILVLANYDWLFLPPAYGVNVSQTLLSIMP